VIATARTEEEKQLVTDLGATETVDYTGDVAAAVRETHPDGADVVLHFAGDPAALLAAVRNGGRFVSTIVGSPKQLPTEDATVVGIYANPDAATLNRCAANHAGGITRISIQRTYRLDEAPAALADFAGGTLGKLIITTG
jgi:NADPH:quinone reductase